MKILLTILDGLGDRPVSELGDKTPLQAAETPRLDFLAEQGVCGLVEPVFTGALPTSEEGHFALFGYDPREYHIKRGFFTARGAGIEVQSGDVALRGNLSAVKESLEIEDRRAGRIKNPGPLVEALDGITVDGVKFTVRSAHEHRLGIVMRPHRGRLSPNIAATDPLYAALGNKARKAEPLDRTPQAAFTAKALNKFLTKAAKILKDHSLNKERRKKDLPPANYILTRGASSAPDLPSFKEKYGLSACCIAGKLLYKQIAETLGMDLLQVKGATGLPNTDLKAKFRTARKALTEYDFVFLHIKATDSLAEDGNYQGKKHFIEKVDRNLPYVFKKPNKDFLWVVTSDHSTCCDVRRHCREPIPILVCNSKSDSVDRFSEKACGQGALGKFNQLEVMRVILEHSGAS